MSPMIHVDRRPFPPIFICNVDHNESASRIVSLTFLTKSVSNEFAFFVQRAHPYRAFLRNHTRTKFTASATTRGSTQFLHPSRLALIITEQSHHLYCSYCSYCFYCFYCFYAIRRVNSTGSHNQRTVNFNTLLVLGTTEKFIIGSLYQQNKEFYLKTLNSKTQNPQDFFEGHLSTRILSYQSNPFLVTYILSSGITNLCCCTKLWEIYIL